MKNSFQCLLFPVFVTLLTFILPACRKEKITEQISNQTTSQTAAEDSIYVSKIANRGCGKFVITVPSGDGYLKFEKVITVPCFTLTIDPKWPFVPGGCTICLNGIPDFRDRTTNPSEIVVFPVNERIVGIEYFVTSPSRTAQNFILRGAVTLTADIKQRFSTNRMLIPSGRYPSYYDRDRNLYLAFLPMQ
ncbi:MAG: hypothetical protein WKG06_07870 [Segetibacter sp.]